MNDQIDAPERHKVTTARALSARRRTSRASWLLLMIVAIAAAVGAGYWYVTKDYISTDDAYTDGRAIMVAPRVAGTVVMLQAADNKYVKAGDVLLEIDPRSYRAERDEAAARLLVADAAMRSAQAALDAARITFPARLARAKAQFIAAQAAQGKAQTDLKRQRSLPRQATTQQDIDTADSALRTADAQVEQAEAAVREADQVDQSIAQAAAKVQQLEAEVSLAKAQLAQAELNLSWTRVTAPHDGWITKRSIESGNYVNAGQAVLSLVTRDVWVTANFKESQLMRMRPNQQVRITVDAYPSLHLLGHIDSVQLGTGQRFSAFPAENATGNFVKIVQRIPVKIIIDSGLDPHQPLPLGLSVVPVVELTHE